MYRSLYIVVFTFCLLLIPGRVAAAVSDEVVFQDDFSNGLTKWQPTRDNGEYWTVENGKAKVAIKSYFTISELVPKDEYWHSSWQDLEYRVQMTPMSGVDRNVSFNFQSISSWFELHFLPKFFNIVSVRNSSLPLDTYHPFLMMNGQTYDLKIQFLRGKTTVFINGLQVASEFDQNFTNQYGKIGLKGSTGAIKNSTVLFDNVEVRLLTDTQDLDVETWKQSDPRWAQTEYDHAVSWSQQPTMKRWGCALTSLAMIFKYHGLQRLPDGTELNPGTLNEWLKNQPDGYIFEGMLNWAAAMRLTRLISERYGTPKLEYRSIRGSSLSPAFSEVAKQHPAILEIAGHFLVAKGTNSTKTDLTIADPAYSFTAFAQHKATLLSTRTFTPSFTDLSYLVIAVPDSVKVLMTNAAGQTIPDLVTETTYLRAADLNQRETTKRFTMLTLAKPVSDTYRLQVLSSTPQEAPLKIFAYQENGNVSDLSQSLVVGPSPRYAYLSFAKDAPSTLTLTSQLSLKQVSQVLFWLRRVLSAQYFTELTTAEHLIAEAVAITPNAQISEQVALFTQLSNIVHSMLPPAPHIIRRYIEALLPVTTSD